MTTSRSIHAIQQGITRTVLQLRQDSNWVNIKITGIISAVLGFLSDTLKSVFPQLSWSFPTAATVTLLGFIIWLRFRAGQNGPTTSRGCWLLARATLCGFIASTVLAPFYALHLAFPDESGALAQLSPTIKAAQDELKNRFNNVDAALGDLKKEAQRGNEQLIVLTEEAKASNKHLQPIEKAMELSSALALLDRAKTNRSGTDQGQVEAFNALIARKHSLAGENLSGVSLANGTFEAADFSGVSLHFSNLSGATFNAAKLEAAGLRFANADHAKFLNKASLVGVYAPFMSARSADFSGSDARKVNFSGADLRAANFSQANLTGAVFAFADLGGANFEGATLTNADFTGALLTKANFTSAILNNTGMFGAMRESDALNAEQRKQVCRPNLQDGSVAIDVRLQERWPSTQFKSGYEYDARLFEYRNYLRSTQDMALPLCLAPSSQDQSAPGFYSTDPGLIEMNVDTLYLEKAQRRDELRRTMKSFVERVERAAGS